MIRDLTEMQRLTEQQKLALIVGLTTMLSDAQESHRKILTHCDDLNAAVAVSTELLRAQGLQA